MIYLLVVSVIWGLSFGLIKTFLSGLDASFIAAVRIGLALLVFMPFTRISRITLKQGFVLMGIGAIQFGIMYISYIYAFNYLKAFQVALFTIFTPIYVIIIDDLLNKSFNPRFILTSLLAITGSGIIVYQDMGHFEVPLGFFIIQISNVCFALGQVFYTRWKASNAHIRDRDVFSVLYLGAALITIPMAWAAVCWNDLELSGNSLLILFYLGVIASGLGFFLWNYGAQKINIGSLAILNNFKIPLGILFALLIFHEETNLLRLLIGGTFILVSLIINERIKNLKGLSK